MALPEWARREVSNQMTLVCGLMKVLFGAVFIPPNRGDANDVLASVRTTRFVSPALPFPVMIAVRTVFALTGAPPWFLALALLWLGVTLCAGPATSAYAPISSPLTSTVDVISLSSEDAARGLPVLVTGVVLMVNRHDRAIVVQDTTGAIYVYPHSPALESFHRGDQVVVTGTTHPGRFAPVVKPASCNIIGTTSLPPAPRVAFTQLMNGAFDGQWVEVSGVARSVSPLPDAPGDALVELVSDELRLPLRFYGTDPAVAQSWIDSQVTVRGVCFHFYNKKGQLFDAQIAVPEGEAYRLQAPPEKNPYLLPVRSLSSLLRYEPHGADPHRVHLRGTVTYVKPGYFFYLQEEANGIQVHTHQKEGPSIGERVEVVGFTSRGAYGPVLEDADFSRMGIQGSVTPARLGFREALEADGSLVEMEGRLVNTFWEPEECVLLVQVAKSLISAHLPSSEKSKTPLAVENGSVIRLTGVCRAVMGSPARSQWKWAPQSFDVLLRTPADLVLVSAVPWWNSSRVLQFALAALVIAVGTTMAFFLRSRARLREQRQNRLNAEGQFAAVFNERNRVAREIHDTLAQGLTGISVQIEMAKERLATPQAALNHLEIARTLVRSSLTEARRSVWGLRPQICENHDLCSALRQISHQLTAGTEISVQVTASPARFHLPPYLESDLLRIGQEAMTNAVKHARPRHIFVELRVTPEIVELRVIDDGRGGADAAARRGGHREGFGITGMRERVEHLRGRFSLSDRAEGGTELRLHVPLSSP